MCLLLLILILIDVGIFFILQKESKFNVRHGSVSLGTIKMQQGLTEVTLTNDISRAPYAVNVIGTDDIVVSRNIDKVKHRETDE